MQKLLRKLSVSIKDQKLDESITLYCKLKQNNIDQNRIVYNLLEDIIFILYRNKYFRVPHGFMGLMAAVDLSEIIQEDKDLPLLQAICYLSHENKLAPLNLSIFTPLYNEADNRAESFSKYVFDGDIPGAYRYFIGVKTKGYFDARFIDELFKLAMEDLVNIGHKAIYFQKILELNEYLDDEPSHLYFPAIAYLASEPKDFTLKNLITKEYEAFRGAGVDLSANNKELTKDDSSYIIALVINSMKTRLFAQIAKLLKDGYSPRSISDTLTLAAAQLVLDTDTDDWVRPVHGFNYCYALNWWQRHFKSKYDVLVLYYQAAFVNQLSVEHKKVHFASASVYVRHRCILNNIVKSIRASNVSDTVSLTQSYVLSDFNVDELINCLAILAVQNSSINNFTHDMKFTSSCINEYKQNKSPLKWLILVALTKQLSQSLKDYEYYTKYFRCMTVDKTDIQDEKPCS